MSQNGENPGLCDSCGGATRVTDIKWINRAAERIEEDMADHAAKVNGHTVDPVSRRMVRMVIENIIITEMNAG